MKVSEMNEVEVQQASAPRERGGCTRAQGYDFLSPEIQTPFFEPGDAPAAHEVPRTTRAHPAMNKTRQITIRVLSRSWSLSSRCFSDIGA